MGTTHEGHLVVFITVQNLVGIDAVVLILCTFFDFASLACKRLFTPQNWGFGVFDPLNGSSVKNYHKRHILAWVRVVWAIMRENPSTGLTCRWVPPKRGINTVRGDGCCQMTPHSGPTTGGTLVTIHGRRFGNGTLSELDSNATVRIGSADCAVLSRNSTVWAIIVATHLSVCLSVCRKSTLSFYCGWEDFKKIRSDESGFNVTDKRALITQYNWHKTNTQTLYIVTYWHWLHEKIASRRGI